jgi:hypothetical protein
MLRFIYRIFKYIFFILFCTTLLLCAGWNVPQTHDDVLKLKDFVEEKFDLDISEKMIILDQAWNKFRGVRKDGFK